MLENIVNSDRKLVTIIDPHVRKDEEYFVYKEASKLGIFVH